MEIDNYDELTVQEVIEHIDEHDPSDEKLQDIYLYEHEHSNRVTLMDELESRFDADGPQKDGPEEEPETLDENADDVSTSVANVTIRVPRGGYYGGHWFDDGGTYEVPYNLRVKAVIDNGRAELVE